VSERICIFCKHYYFDSGSPGYSELTPGYEAEEGCKKGEWQTNMFKDDEADHRRNLLRARTCKKYKYYKFIEIQRIR